MKKKSYHRKIIGVILYIFGFFANAQVGINVAAPHPNAQLEVFSNSRGLQVPRLTTGQRDAMSPALTQTANGIIIFNLTTKCLEYYDGVKWVSLCDEGPSTTVDPTVTSLDCTGAFTASQSGNGTKVITYTGGNGRPYGPISIASTGVTGLTATAPAGTLANGDGSITLNISGNPSSSGTAEFTINLGGKTCTFSITVPDKVSRRINILSLVPDKWSSNLSNDSNTSIARSKLNNSSNFGPSGAVKVQGFNYKTINLKTSSDQTFRDAIDNADIIWVGYITNGNFPQSKRDILVQKINEKKKFFYLGADGGKRFFPFPNFGGYSFVSTPNNKNANITSSNVPTTNGIFGTLSTGSTIIFNRYIGGISFPASAIPFMNTSDGRPTGIINDNVVIVGDVNWYINRGNRDGFRGGSSSCTENNNSILFCNIIAKAIEYISTH